MLHVCNNTLHTRDEHVLEALTGLRDTLVRRDRDAYLGHLADLLATPCDADHLSYDRLMFVKAFSRLTREKDAEEVVAAAGLRILQAANRTFDADGEGAEGSDAPEDDQHGARLDVAWLLSRRVPAAAFGRYVGIVATNLTTDLLRVRGRFVSLSEEVAEHLVCSTEDQLLARLDVEQALSRLDPALELVVRLVHLEGWRHAEVAQWLGVSRPTVSGRVQQGVRRLRELLDDYS